MSVSELALWRDHSWRLTLCFAHEHLCSLHKSLKRFIKEPDEKCMQLFAARLPSLNPSRTRELLQWFSLTFSTAWLSARHLRRAFEVSICLRVSGTVSLSRSNSGEVELRIMVCIVGHGGCLWLILLSSWFSHCFFEMFLRKQRFDRLIKDAHYTALLVMFVLSFSVYFSNAMKIL